MKNMRRKLKILQKCYLKLIATKLPFEFELFSGGKNKKFDEVMRSIGVSSDNIDFLDFLHSDISKRILTSKKLKIHLETGIINYNDQDTNESIFDFFYKQQDSTKGVIDYDFVYSGDYFGYFDWLIHRFDSYQKSR